jgi:hypothetical protein
VARRSRNQEAGVKRIPQSLAVAWLLLVSVASAQGPLTDSEIPDADRRQVVPFLEGTDIFLNAPRSQITFEADIQPNLVVAQNFSDKLVYDQSLDGRFRFAFSIVGTPRVRLRMFDTRSAPVRTPSYMPKGSGSLLLFRGEADRRDRGPRVGIWAGQVTVGHHSNGQDGCLFTTDTLVGDDCVGTPDLTQINTKDGSFSTNFVRFGARYRREWLTEVNVPGGDREYAGTKQLTFGVDFDKHFHTDPRVAPFYGLNRFRGMAGAAIRLKKVCRSRAAVNLTVAYVGEEPENVAPLVFQAEGLCTFTDRGGWGLFVRYYHGQDYYNLAFTEEIHRMQFGVHYEQDGFLRFISAAAQRRAQERQRQLDAR